MDGKLRSLQIADREPLVKNREDYQCQAEKLFKAQAMLKAARSRARKKRIIFNIDLEYLMSIFPDECPVFKLPFYFQSQVPIDFSPSLDRITTEGGYTKGNVQIISNLANKMKSNASVYQLKQFAEWIHTWAF